MTDQAVYENLHRGKMDGSRDLLCLLCLGTIFAPIDSTEADDPYMPHTCHSSFIPAGDSDLQ